MTPRPSFRGRAAEPGTHDWPERPSWRRARSWIPGSPSAPRNDGRWRLGQVVLAALLLALSSATAFAAEPDLPNLTGRVTDAANILAPEARERIEAKLKAYDDKTTDQVVVATVPSLQGLTVEEFANRLFRAWALGRKDKNNGALLLVAPNERKVRIEVGYGLEGALTDALGKVIITTAITPKFKQGDFAGGIEAGVDAMLSILTGDAEEWHRRAEVREDGVDSGEILVWIVVIVFLIVFIGVMSGGARSTRGRRSGGGVVFVPGSSGGWSGGYSSGGSDSSDSFSGDGGSSGGGGASGDW